MAAVTEDSPAAEAGIEPHDVILVNNGVNLEHAEDDGVLQSITSSDQVCTGLGWGWPNRQNRIVGIV